MSQIELKQKIEDFKAKMPGFRADWEEMEKLTNEFLDKFPISSIPDLPLENYVIGKRENDNFCPWLERKLKDVGNMFGSNSLKFGIYYGHTKADDENRYRYPSKFWAETPEHAYLKVNQAIVSLLKDGEKKNLAGVSDNPLATVFKGKILATYYPNYYIHIYADHHLDYFLKNLRLPVDGDAVVKRERLRQHKENDQRFSNWSLFEYYKFLYDAFGHPRTSNFEEQLENTLEEIKSIEFPDISSVQAEYVDLQIHPKDPEPPAQSGGKRKKKSKKRNYLDEYILNKALGDRGEEIVFEAEKKRLGINGKTKLVKWVSQKDDSLGYDILSCETDGTTLRYIEVKATKEKQGVVNFLITPNELQKSKELENYYVYIVFEVLSTTPKIWRWKSPFKPENPAVIITPVQYRVTANTSVFST